MPRGCDLEQSIAYADSTSDLPLLECVGFPVAVNPETRLAAIARKRGWLVEHWSKASGAPTPLLPIGPMLRRARARTDVRMTPNCSFVAHNRSTRSLRQSCGGDGR